MRRIAVLLALMPLLGACSALPGGPKQHGSRPSGQVFASGPDARQCLAELGATRANFTPLPDRYYGGGCSNVNTVTLANLRSDSNSLSLSNMGPVTCSMASSFAGWARYGADRAARQILGSPLVRIETMGSYSCRNVAGTARRSAHATANAIDVAAFVLADGRRVSVLDDWFNGTRDEREFLHVVQESACKRFATVLSPEYNAAHRDHLHVEVGTGGRPYCR
jgi:hypothetical protein